MEGFDLRREGTEIDSGNDFVCDLFSATFFVDFLLWIEYVVLYIYCLYICGTKSNMINHAFYINNIAKK